MGKIPGSTLPNPALSALITTKLPRAPANTVERGCRIARIAEMRNVLSPISVRMIMVNDCSKAACVDPPEVGGGVEADML